MKLSGPSPSIVRLATGLVAAALIAASLPSNAADDKQDFSAAERLLFMTHQLSNLRPPVTLHYSFQKSGALEEGFQDRVGVLLGSHPDGSCCTGKGEFLSGPRRQTLPDVDGATGNPVILYFLEHDVREMQRLTKGSQSYFRKRIRMAVFEGATVQDVSLRYQGRGVKGQEVAFAPYLDDPNRPRYDRLARKHYQFLLSDAVPGGVFGIRTLIRDQKADAPPLIVEELFIDGAEPPVRKDIP